MPALRPWIERPARQWIAAAGGYFALAWLSDQARFVHEGVPLILLAQGVAFSAVQLGGPWLATAVAVGAAGEGFRGGLPAGAVLLLAAAAAAAGLAAYAVTRLAGLRTTGERVVDTLIRAGGVAAGAIAAASFGLGAIAVVAPTNSNPAEDWAALLLANAAGMLVVSPFLRAWIERLSAGVARLPEWIALVAVAIGSSAVVDAAVLGAAGPSAYLVFPVVVWAALRAGRMGVTAVVLVSALIGVENTSDGRGPFVGAQPLGSAVSLNSFLVVLALTGLLLVGLEQERRQIETGLSDAEERHRRLIDQLPLVTYIRSLEDIGAPMYVSPQTEDLLGYPIERWLAEPRFAATLIHPDDRQLHDDLNVRSLTEDAVRGEYRMIRADGRVVWVLDHMTVVRNAAGEPVARQGFVVDISERKALEEQLGQAQRLEALGLLAGGVAHDFNNLLTAISGYTGLALEHAGEDNELVRRDLAEVKTAAGRAAALTRQLLAFSRRQVLGRTVIDLNDVVIEAQLLLDRVIGERVAVVTDLDPDLVRVRADAGQLGQVLVNLAVNARDAMPDGGTLTIATTNEDGDAVITVSDTGHGMDEQTRDRIFEPFFSTKPVGEGTGLGLAMVHGIVQQTGGEITVRSAPGCGAEFRIVLPGTNAPADETGVPVQASPVGSETVLLVEDEEIVRRLVAEMLESQGYHVIAAAGPDEALEVTEPYDLLLTDVVMPSMSGPELAELLVERRPGVGLLFTSGYAGRAVADRSTLTADLLEKPFTIEQLAAKVREALDARLSR